MNSRLISYYGLDEWELEGFDENLIYNIQGFVLINKTIEDILSFSVTNEIIDIKKIEIFEDVNYEGYEVNGELTIATLRFNLTFEYSCKDDNSKINVLNRTIYKTFCFNNYTNDSINSNYILSLVCQKNNINEIYYNIYGTIYPSNW